MVLVEVRFKKEKGDLLSCTFFVLDQKLHFGEELVCSKKSFLFQMIFYKNPDFVQKFQMWLQKRLLDIF
jgi:hypothetical protein